ncbi:MAG: extracellular solute-binding protein [Bacilli bacterium]|jgi:ABC-type glycerol-3-phosphate transport system substrate-binding protein
MKNKKPIFYSLVMMFLLSSCGPKDNRISVAIGMWPETQQTQDVAMFNVWKERFESDYPEYKIVAQPYQYDQTTVAANAMSGTLPTIFQTYFTEPRMLIKNQYIRAVTDIVQELDYYDDMEISMRHTLEDDEGNLYGVPRDGYGFGVLMNLKTLNFYGLIEGDYTTHDYQLYDGENNPLYPTTYQELLELGASLSEVSGGSVNGTIFYSANRQGGWLLSNLSWAFGAELQVEETGNWRGNLATEEVVNTLLYLQDLKNSGALPQDKNVFTYNDWYNYIGSRVGFVFAGNDVIQNAVTQAQVDRRDLAFIPMPEGPEGQYSLYGGTPFVFARNASDDQVRGALKFLEYMGRSPKLTDNSRLAMTEGKETSKAKNEPILPSIRPWTNSDYNEFADQLDDEYVNINMEYFKDFYDTIDNLKHAEEPYFAQEMYDLLDQAVLESLRNPYRSGEEIMNQLVTLNSQFNRLFD